MSPVILLILSVAAIPQEKIPETTSKLVCRLLDKIDSVSYYTRIKENELELKTAELLSDSTVSNERYVHCIGLAEAYSKFSSDSSILYFKKAEETAEALGRNDLTARARLGSVKILSTIGYFKEASDILEGIETSRLPDSLLPIYYSSRSSLYHEMYQYNRTLPRMHEKYVNEYTASQDSLLKVADRDSDEYLRILEKRYARKGEYQSALEINDSRMERLDTDSSLLALVLFDRYAINCIYRHLSEDEGIDYLLNSTIMDIEHSNQETGSTKYIINYLLSHGLVSETKALSDYYYGTMLRYGNRIRRANAFEPELEISTAFIEQISAQKKRIQTTMAFILILSAILVVLLTLTMRSQRKIKRLNSQLTESDSTSKIYMMEFFRLYSEYVERNLSLKAKINTRLRRGKIEELLEMTGPDKSVFDKELKMMYSHFDTSFLSLYPDFAKKFNAMLRDECKMTLKPGELNTELRIFALIKLGVTSSNQISELLHYSIKTVYNKRSEIKNRICVPEDVFYAGL